MRHIRFMVLLGSENVKGRCSSYVSNTQDDYYEFIDVLFDNGRETPVLRVANVPVALYYLKELL